jgi:predicted permease
MLSDIKLALRQLVASPGFLVTAILTLALGIAANAVVFSVLNAVILKPLDLPGSERLLTIQRFKYPSQSYPDYLDMRDRNHAFDGMLAVQLIGSVGVDAGSNPSTAWPYLASGNYFDVLGVQPYLGRFFHAADEKGYNSAPYIVLSYAYWHSHFHDDHSIVGRTLAINKHPMTVLGVAPPRFRGTELFFAPAMWIPIVEQPIIEGDNGLQWRGNHSPWVIGHLRPGVTPAAAQADLDSLANWMKQTYPKDDEDIRFTLAKPGLVGDFFGGPARAFVGGLMLLAGLILLAACANLGSLFAARAADRAKEVALRLALGSRRALILRQLLTEALLVSLAGGAAGLGLAIGLLHALSNWNPIPDVPINVPVNPDLRTYLVALALALVSGFLFGIVPVRQVLGVDPWQTLRAGARAGSSMRRLTLRDVLLAVQIAICAVLVTASLVAVRGMARSLSSDFGFQPQNAILLTSDLHMAGYKDDEVPRMQQRMIQAAQAIPGVTSVGTINQIPLGLGGSDSSVYLDTVTDFRPSTSIADAMNYRISPGYVAAAGTRLIAGRDFTESDTKQSPKVAVINELFAQKVFGSAQKAIGGHFKFWGGERAEVVGVVANGRYRSLTEEQQPAFFLSYRQYTESGTVLVVRSSRAPSELAPALDRAIRSLDSGLPFTLRTWSSAMDGALFAPHVAAVALGVLGLLGAMLAVTGIFGMASYVVSRRLRELGIRVALGASRRQVLSTALGRALRVLAIGSVAGLILGLLSSRVLGAIVYQATPRDPAVLFGVTATMLALGLVASWIPARRALAVDPIVLLRDE